MAEPFKNLFNPAVINAIANHLSRHAPDFNKAAFTAQAVHGLDSLELKERSIQITGALLDHLPEPFPLAAEALLASLHPNETGHLKEMKSDDRGLAGWAIMPMADYVAKRGQDHFDLSMTLLKEMTKRSSAEFAIRPFIQAEPARSLEVLAQWVTDPNHHVRRLVSEGSRPRLPWGMRLTDLVKDPAPLLPLLEALKDDEEEYVRRSVANNLNDIAKDHPHLVEEIANRWMESATPTRQKLVRHGLRTLVKAGRPRALAALGYGPAQVRLEKLDVLTPVVTFGEALQFEAVICSTANAPQNLIIDYVVHHRKANGSTTPKVFKWKTQTLNSGGRIAAIRKHPMKPITTRKYYPGPHSLELSINGTKMGKVEFDLEML